MRGTAGARVLSPHPRQPDGPASSPRRPVRLSQTGLACASPTRATRAPPPVPAFRVFGLSHSTPTHWPPSLRKRTNTETRGERKREGRVAAGVGAVSVTRNGTLLPPARSEQPFASAAPPTALAVSVFRRFRRFPIVSSTLCVGGTFQPSETLKHRNKRRKGERKGTQRSRHGCHQPPTARARPPDAPRATPSYHPRGQSNPSPPPSLPPTALAVSVFRMFRGSPLFSSTLSPCWGDFPTLRNTETPKQDRGHRCQLVKVKLRVRLAIPGIDVERVAAPPRQRTFSTRLVGTPTVAVQGRLGVVPGRRRRQEEPEEPPASAWHSNDDGGSGARGWM